MARKLLPLEFTKGIFMFAQVERGPTWAIYRQTSPDLPGWEAFEVVIPCHRPAAIVFGNAQPDREAYPPSESWGKRAWTYPTINAARQRVARIGQDRDTSP